MITIQSMKNNLLFFCFFLTLVGQQMHGYAQPIQFNTGIFLSAESIENNQPDYTLEELVIKEGKTKRSKFFQQSTASWFVPTQEQSDQIHSVNVKRITRRDSTGEKVNIPVRSVLAIANEMGIYFKIKKMFVKAGIEGSICHIPIEKITSMRYSDRTYDYQDERQADRVKHSAKQFLYKINMGTLEPFNTQSLEVMIADDKELYAHFLKNEKRAEQLYLYLKKYNDRHPL